MPCSKSLLGFHRSVLCVTLSVVGLLLTMAAPAQASIILGDSGWQVDVVGSRVSVTVNVVESNPGQGFLKISLDKDFGAYLIDNGQYDFPVAQLNFTPGSTAVGRIIIDHETIVNHTGAPWNEFRWDIFQGGSAVFNEMASGLWNVSPFATWSATNPSGAGYLHVGASDGTINNNAQFLPTGGLAIDATGAFTLKESVVPEPGTLAMLACGVFSLLARRRRV